MFLTVVAGAFGGHALKTRLSEDMRAIFEVAVRYQAYHALALFAVAWMSVQMPSRWVTYAGVSFIAGIFLFSGSLYILSLSGIRWLGAITPLGGLLFLAGWAFVVLAARA
jgi:uncharacterized membrane protein YgdD (TMEM256/DUF423 family)